MAGSTIWQVLKAGLYFARPAFGLKQLERVSPERARDFVYAGIGLLVFAALIAVGLVR